MNIEIASRKKAEGYIKLSTLIIIAFASAFFARLFDTIGFPSYINFLHFATVPLTFGIVLFTTKTKNSYQIAATWTLLSGLLILIGVLLVSALLNQAGLINVIMDFLLLAESFLLLIALISLNMYPKTLERMQVWIIRFCFINLILAYLQHYIIIPLIYSSLKTTLLTVDLVQGVFYISGAGNSLSASVSMFFGLYYFQSGNKAPLWLRITVMIAAFWQVIISDSKQVLVVFILAWGILALTKVKDIKKLLLSVIGIVLILATLLWCAENLQAFRPFKTYLDPEWYDLNSRTMQIKLASVQIIPSYYKSPLNWFFGLGPGHTVGRLGGWMLKDYDYLLIPFGATVHPASQAVWDRFSSLAFGGVIGSISTFFSPFWGWAGIWGDIGFVGLGAYLYLGYLVWSKLCTDDFCKLLLLNIVIFGFIFTQLEEPAYMLSIAMFIGLRWHENRLESYNLNDNFSN
ncbi:hypothetical protein [Halotia branconii]|uniref:Uncharacterized protein n=1 Tax=Halotia branconii CENA392 TaxID=1539056 RepID=A0AAJ6PB61_9CYAN|nr:hypothetical protein [Halotia branconii]WGV27599.1 hypothetical protein QI031_08985 [Halotia branconii CENA392]